MSESTPRRRRRSTDTTEEAALESGAAAAPEETFPLREGSVVLGVLLLLGGLALAGLGGLALLGGPSSFSLALFGFGLALAGGGYAITFARQNLRQLTIGPGGATILSTDGSSATIPHAILTGARVHHVTQSTTSSGSRTTTVTHYVHLQKRDGGTIDLGAQRDQPEAQRLASELTAALERLRPAIEPAPEDAVAILRDSPLVDVQRGAGDANADYRKAARPGDLVIEWSLRPKHTEVVPAVLVPLGFAAALRGIHLGNPSPLVLVLAVVIAAVTLFVIVRLVSRLRAFQRTRISDTDITSYVRRGGRASEVKSVPLAEVSAVDFSLSSQTLGGVLQIRRNDAQKPQLPESLEAPSAGALGALVKQAIDLHRNSVNIPLGRLPFGDRVRVDLAISAEIAQRTGRGDAEL